MVTTQMLSGEIVKEKKICKMRRVLIFYRDCEIHVFPRQSCATQ